MINIKDWYSVNDFNNYVTDVLYLPSIFANY